MLPWIANETVTRLRGVASANADGYGDPGADWAQSPSRLDIPGCSVQPVVGQEVLDGRDAVVSRWTWFGPFAADVQSTDRIEYLGVAYEVDGSVQRWRDPSGSGLDHSTAVLRRSDG